VTPRQLLGANRLDTYAALALTIGLA